VGNKRKLSIVVDYFCTLEKVKDRFLEMVVAERKKSLAISLLPVGD